MAAAPPQISILKLLFGSPTYRNDIKRYYNLSPANSAQATATTTKQKGQSKEQAQPAGRKGTTPSASAPAPATAAQGNPNWSGDDFTAEQDKTLLALKAENKIWKEITEAVGRSASTCKTRYKHLTGGGQAQAQAQAESSKAQGDQQKQKQTDQKAGEGDKGKEQAGEKEKGKGKGKGKGKDGVQEVELEPDAVFSKEDLELLCYLYYQSRHDFWVSIASQFFDRTGRRLSPDVISAKFSVPS